MNCSVFINDDGIIQNKRIKVKQNISEICNNEYNNVLKKYDAKGIKYKLTNEYSFVDIIDSKVLNEDIYVGVSVEKECTVSYDIDYIKPKKIKVKVSLI